MAGKQANLNLVRLGHYHVPNGIDDTGSCQTALVVGVDNESAQANLAVWTHTGGTETRINVPIDGTPDKTAAAQAKAAEEAANGGAPLDVWAPTHSFHLAGDCPWKR